MFVEVVDIDKSGRMGLLFGNKIGDSVTGNIAKEELALEDLN